MPHRYVDAVRARRCELRAVRSLLVGGHRAELRSCLALSRLAAAADAAAELAALRREATEHVDRADLPARERLPVLLSAALHDVVRDLHRRWAAGLLPPLRRIAVERGLVMGPGWPRLPAPVLPAALPPPPERVGPARSLLAAAVAGAALWRVALLPLALVPLFGLPAVAGPVFAPLAVGAGVAGLVIAARKRRTRSERLRLLRHTEQVLAAATTAIETDLDRRLVEVEHATGAALDAAVLRRRAGVDAELALLSRGGQSDG